MYLGSTKTYSCPPEKKGKRNPPQDKQEGGVWEGAVRRVGDTQNRGEKGGLTYSNLYKMGKLFVVLCMHC